MSLQNPSIVTKQGSNYDCTSSLPIKYIHSSLVIVFSLNIYAFYIRLTFFVLLFLLFLCLNNIQKGHLDYTKTSPGLSINYSLQLFPKGIHREMIKFMRS